MKKLSLKKLNLGTNDLLQRNQLKTVLGGDGGYGGNSGPGDGLCSCKTNGAITYQGYVGDCETCGDLCHYSNPASTGWICVGA